MICRQNGILIAIILQKRMSSNRSGRGSDVIKGRGRARARGNGRGLRTRGGSSRIADLNTSIAGAQKTEILGDYRNTMDTSTSANEYDLDSIDSKCKFGLVFQIFICYRMGVVFQFKI